MPLVASRTRRSLLQSAATLAACAMAPASWAASPQKFPSRPIKLYMPTPPGSTFDTILRGTLPEVEKRLGQPVIVDYRSGAGGTPAFVQAKSSPPDGYSLTFVSLSVIRQPLVENVSYEGVKDFSFIAALTDVNFGVVVPADSPFRTWADLIAFGRKTPEQVQYGAPAGLGNSAHIFGAEVASRAGVRWEPIPYRASSDCIVALLAGQLTFSIDTLIATAPHIKAGKLRLLAVATDEPVRAWPDVPTMRQLGYGVSIDAPVGIGGPARLPPEIVAVLEDAWRHAVAQPGFARMLEPSAQSPHFRGHAEYQAFAVKAEAEQRALLGKYGLLRQK